MGYTNIKVMLKGVPGWKKSGRMVFASDRFVKEGNIVLIDLRSADEYIAGHIPRAVNIPYATLEDAEDQFPAMKAQVPIVLSGDADQVKNGAKTIKSWGYQMISAVDGDISAWQRAGNDVEKGSSRTEIVWEYVPGKGEIGIAEFKKVVAGKLPDKVIFDVRSKEEVSEGLFAGAINLPLEELDKRMAELPLDKELIFHCSTGARAEMASQNANKAGLKSRFLVANVECDEGECEIEE